MGQNLKHQNQGISEDCSILAAIRKRVGACTQHYHHFWCNSCFVNV